jgi:GNAT superfamily N-acetyltransferase
MKIRILDVELDNLHLAPKECLSSVFWELDEEPEDLDPLFHKEEWFSSTLLEWGRCGKLLVEGDTTLVFSQYAPPTLFPRLRRFRAGDASADAAYLSCVYVVEGRRGRGFGAQVVRAVARDVVERGYAALESIGDREWDGGWVLPHDFLHRLGFRVLRDDARFPLMRLDLMAREPISEAVERVAMPLPALGVV